jgi:anti-sigma-K factor RskA
LNDAFDEAPAPDLLPAIEARLFPVASRPAATARRFGFGWLAGALVAAAVALVTVATLAPPRPDRIATLATADNRLAYEVTHFGETLQVARVAGVPAVAGQVHEFWVIAPGAQPVSLGLLEGGPLVVTYPVPPEGFILAVSVEPAGGSPTGAPTGPVILTAKIGDAT